MLNLTNNLTFGEALEMAIAETGLPRKVIASNLGISVQFLSKCENDESYLSLTKLKQLQGDTDSEALLQWLAGKRFIVMKNFATRQLRSTHEECLNINVKLSDIYQLTQGVEGMANRQTRQEVIRKCNEGIELFNAIRNEILSEETR